MNTAMTSRPAPHDELLIRDLYARYSWALDTGDTDAYVQLYAADAVIHEQRPDGDRQVRGHEEIRAFVRRFHDDPAFPGRQHRTSQLVILPDPQQRENRWLVRAYVLTTEFRDGRASVYWCGHTADVVVKVGEDWCIEHRDIRPWAGDVLQRFAARG